MRSWLWLLGFCLVLALPACSDDKPATDAGPDVAIGDGATDSDGGGGDAGEAKASGPNPLVPEQALYPWPSDYYLVADSSTATGRRLEVPAQLLPFGVKPDAMQGVDGFSLIPSILSCLPGGVDKASHPTPDVTITKASAVMLVEQGSWEQVPLLVENDATAADDSQRALILRPRIILADEPVSMIDASLRATVLGSLQRLKEEFGISIIYITHDLTTAYQIGDNIIVLYRGGVAEAGSVDLVVRQPNHPYTQLLVNSIPVADPDQPWTAESSAALAGQKRGKRSCRFVERCPAAMAKCLQEAPTLFQTEPQRAEACFLYAEAPALEMAEMDRVL